MRITALEPQKRHPTRVSVFVDGEYRLGLPQRLAHERGLRVGAEVADEELRALEREDALAAAREAALRLLARRARSETELRRRLKRKGIPGDVLESVLAELRERRYLDDASFAQSLVRDRVRLRPRARRVLLAELADKGIADPEARLAVDTVFADEAVSEMELAARAADAWARRTLRGDVARLAPEARLKLRRRLYAHLARRGFRGEPARAAVERVFGSSTE